MFFLKWGRNVNEDFLLSTPMARRLYHECAKNLPIIDYHNHLNAQELLADGSYENLARLWLISDPYKHRAMRICGVEEKYITRDASDYEKFVKWMSVLPRLIGNPLYDWSVLEMKRIFDIDLIPGVTDTDWIWETANQKLKEPAFSPMALLKTFHVEYAAPCAGITEDVSAFSGLPCLAPSLRADTLVTLQQSLLLEMEKLTQTEIRTLEDFTHAVSVRLDAFHEVGCRFSDHALDNGFSWFEDDGNNEVRFSLCVQGKLTDPIEKKKLESTVLRILASEYAKRGWTMQLHIGAQRHTSSRLRELAGPAGGFAGIGNCCDVTSLTDMLDCFEKSGAGMPKVILFTLNPADNAVMSVLSGSYSQDGVTAKVQQGPAWWWCDHLQGMREVFEHISSFGVLSTFIGMTTDSRSILSFIRHEYFRRALCGWLGEKVERGEMIAPEAALRKLVQDVCYNNAKQVIGI